MKLGRGLTLLVALMFLPLLSRILAGALVAIGGCRAEPGSTAACLIGGADWGRVIGWLAAFGWLAVVSLPLAGILVAIAVLQPRKG